MSKVPDRWYATRDGVRVKTARHGKGKRWDVPLAG
jgi:hypothetical protein